jgi:hypothetical protein
MRTRLPDIETKYEGQRTDGTHAVNGTAYIGDRTETFQCSFNRAGDRITLFVVNQRSAAKPAPPKTTTPASARAGIRTETVRFKSGQTSTSIKGKITGRESVSYVLEAEAGQTMTVILKPLNRATYFNVYEPGKGPGDRALANSGLTGPMMPDLNTFRGKLPAPGEYTISVYMMRSAARRNEGSDYTLNISISALGDTTQNPAGRDARVAGTNFNATGNIPCARHAGQPMGSCRFGVIRKGEGSGAITVFWPDGGNSVIVFENGTPAYFDQSKVDGNVRMTVGRTADLFTVTIGQQRFEIPEAVITGG